MTDVLDVAQWACEQLADLGLEYSLIGGIALQFWGESRVTRDVDLTVLTGFVDEPAKVLQILSRIPPRMANAAQHAAAFRVLLCQSPSGIGIDIGLAGFPFEEAALARSQYFELVAGKTVRVIGAEDLVIMKVFAGRPRDWEDIKGVLIRQQSRLDWDVINSALPELLEAIEAPERLEQLERLRALH